MYAATAEMILDSENLFLAEKIRLQAEELLANKYGIAHFVLAIRPQASVFVPANK